MIKKGVLAPQVPANYRKSARLVLRELRTKPAEYFIKKGETRALALFHEMARRVPAYGDFLKKHKINPAQIKTVADFKKVPLIDKDNYLKKYPLEKLCWDGNFNKASWDIAATSGSTGEPFYFPRTDEQNEQYAVMAELYLLTNFHIDTQSTLYINAFPLGVWIGGLFTYEAIKMVGRKGGYRLSVINPGINKAQIIQAVKRFGGQFDQIVIGCYGPFLKDAIDEGIEQGIDWKRYNLKFIFSAEAFSETFRDYIVEAAGLKNPCRDTLNHYGTVDLGTMSYETPVSILIRKLALEHSQLYERIFPIKFKLPTLTQFFPDLFFFESLAGNLVCSAFSGIPLARYDLKDHGGIIDFSDMLGLLEDSNVDIAREAKKSGIYDTMWKLPFVYVYERNDFSVSFYALQIYPETVRKALQAKEFRQDVTGKFTMLVKFDKRQNQYLEINVELKPRREDRGALRDRIEKAITEKLLKENSEYQKTYSEISDRARPKVVFWAYESPLYFMPGTKQRWVKMAH